MAQLIGHGVSTPRTAVGKLIRDRRVQLGLAGGKFALSMGFSAQHLSHIELGITPLPFSQMKALLQILNISRDDLFNALVDDLQQKFLGAIDGHY